VIKAKEPSLLPAVQRRALPCVTITGTVSNGNGVTVTVSNGNGVTVTGTATVTVFQDESNSSYLKYANEIEATSFRKNAFKASKAREQAKP
jgi:hypothetical protein